MQIGARSLPAADSQFVVGADLEHLSHDRDMAMKIMKKRTEELQRRSKLLDPRKRQFGVDHSVLDAQVAEKQAAKAAEAAEDAYYAQTLAQQELVLQTVESLKQEAQRQRQKDTVEYSLANLHKEQRREYKLSCPKEYVSSAITHPEEELGPCSMTKFEGEAVDQVRRREMKHEMAEWLKQQMQEKKDRELAEKEWNRELDLKLLDANNIRTHCEIASIQETKEDKIAEAQDNLALAAEKREQLQARKQRDFDEKMAHVEHVRGSDFMKETHDYKVGATGRISDVKRTSLLAEQEVYNTNAYMLLDKKMKREAERKAEAQNHQLTLGAVTVLSAVESEAQRLRKERAQQIVAENQSFAAAKRANDIKDKRAYLSFDYLP